MTDSRGKVSFDFIQLSDGGSWALKSGSSGPQYVVKNTDNSPTRPIIDPEPLYECGDTIRAQKLVNNAEVQLLRTDGLPLNEPQPVMGIDPLLLSLPHRIGRMPDDVGGFHAFQLIQRGCGEEVYSQTNSTQNHTQERNYLILLSECSGRATLNFKLLVWFAEQKSQSWLTNQPT